jgi:hypothetical protein
MRFVVRRGAAHNDITINDGKASHNFDMAPLQKHERDRVREMLVNQWASVHGFPLPYNI